MKTHHSVRIVVKDDQREKTLKQIRDLLAHIDSYIEGKRPRRTSLRISITIHFPNMSNKKLSQEERQALKCLLDLNAFEENIWDEVERHTLNTEDKKALARFLRVGGSECTVRIKQFYVSRNDKSWGEKSIRARIYPEDHFKEPYYEKIKSTYEKMLNVLKDAPTDLSPVKRGVK